VVGGRQPNGATKMTSDDAMLEIQELLDGVEWTPDTLDRIAEIMVTAGYPIRNKDWNLIKNDHSHQSIIAIKNLKPDDMVDLYNDPYADPNGDKIEYQWEYCVVYELKQETENCIMVYFNNTVAIGFPPDHKVKLANDDRA
jgi:hypothetical protein